NARPRYPLLIKTHFPLIKDCIAGIVPRWNREVKPAGSLTMSAWKDGIFRADGNCGTCFKFRERIQVLLPSRWTDASARPPGAPVPSGTARAFLRSSGRVVQ